MLHSSPIGVFDSGYGGLTILKEIEKELPGYDLLYLGDNARTPYGPRSFETVYEYTLECVKWLFKSGCPLVILACNTASAKALRTIQQKDLPVLFPGKKILGVIRPTAEVIGNYSKEQKIGILGTTGTINSLSYVIEINKFFPEVEVIQQACPMWVPIIENNELESEGAEYFYKKYVNELFSQEKNIDAVLLACTHYPLIEHLLKPLLPKNVQLVSQGKIVAESLKDYLRRHPEVAEKCSRNNQLAFFTTDSTVDFDRHSAIFYGKEVQSRHVQL